MRSIPLWALASEKRQNVLPSTLGSHVIHYSIPSVDRIGTGAYEESAAIQSAKLLLAGGELLISKLNPRKSRVVVVAPSKHPIVSSTEFIGLQPRPSAERRYLSYVLQSEVVRQHLDSLVQSVTRSHQRVAPEDVLHIAVPDLEVGEQRRIADFLDAETSRIDTLISKQSKLVALLDNRINARIMMAVGSSPLSGDEDGEVPILPIRRLLRKMRRPAVDGADFITAYRDGQVTARSLRRAEGYTLSASAETTGQYVQEGDVVVHGLDGFAGAIGTSEASGNCSPVYHVCLPLSEGSPQYLGRLLHVLAIEGYLGLFATSTRERAVDFRNWDTFGRIPIPHPSPTEQNEVAEWIQQIPSVKGRVARFNDLANERRQALITAAVTGQFDVSAASGRNTTQGV